MDMKKKSEIRRHMLEIFGRLVPGDVLDNVQWSLYENMTYDERDSALRKLATEIRETVLIEEKDKVLLG